MTEENNNYTIAVTNKRICEFYNNNPNVDFENVNLLLIDFMESIFNNMTNDLNSNINYQLLSFMKDNQKKIENISNSLNTVNQSVTNLTNNMVLQMNNMKKEYIDDFSQIINTNSLSSNEKISSLIDKSNSILVDKTTLILNDIIPKNQGTLQIQIKESLKELHNSITNDTYKLSEKIYYLNSSTEILNLVEIGGIMDYVKDKKESGLMLAIDFRKAFDSINHKFLFKSLKHFGFGRVL